MQKFQLGNLTSGYCKRKLSECVNIYQYLSLLVGRSFKQKTVGKNDSSIQIAIVREW